MDLAIPGGINWYQDKAIVSRKDLFVFLAKNYAYVYNMGGDSPVCEGKHNSSVVSISSFSLVS